MSTPRGILYVNHEVECGGGEHSLLALLRGLDRERYGPQLLCPEEGPLSHAARELDVPVHLLPMRFTTRAGKLVGLWRSARSLRAMLAELSIDLLHANSLHAGYVSLYAATRLDVPVVWHVRDIGYPAAARWACRRANRVIANSRATADDLGVETATVIYNGVEECFFSAPDTRAEVRDELGVPGDALLVGTIGRLDPWKGHEDFLEAAAAVHQMHPSAVFLVVGDLLFESCRRNYGNRREQLETHTKKLGLGGITRFLGNREDVPRLLGALDILVHPSVEPEPFGRSIVEAMAAGVPVVATRVGGVPEIVTDEENGLLVPPGDPAALAKQVSRVLGDDALRARLAMAGQAAARSRFTIESHVEAVQKLYEGMLEPVAATSS